MSKDEVMLIRASLEFYKERCDRAIKKSVHEEIVAFYRKQIFKIEEVLSKLEVV